MAGVKKHIVSDMPRRDTMSYEDHIEKLHAKGEVTDAVLESSRKMKHITISKYDL